MAIIKISELPAATSPLSPTEVIPALQSGVTKKVAIDQLGYTPSGTSTVTRTIQQKLRETLSVKDFGAIGDGVADDTVAIQTAMVQLALNGGQLVFPYGTYLITNTIILPFGNNATDKQFTVDFGNSVVKSNVLSPTNSTFTGFISGYLSGTTPIADTSGTEGYVAANAVFMNLNLRGFGTAIRLNNFNYGCAFQNIQTESCFNGINLTRCFYLVLNNISLRGTGINANGTGFRTTAFSNIMPMSGIKVGQFTTGLALGGFDGGKLTDCSAEGCQVGVDLVSESTAIHLDTIYLEGNTVADIRVSAVIRRCLVTNSWLFNSDATKHIVSTIGNSEYANFTFINTVVNGGFANTPINNIFGDVLNYGSDPTNAPQFSGLPNIRTASPRYEIDTSGVGYNGPVRSLDSREYNGLISTAYGGRFRNGISGGNKAPYQTVANVSGSLEFTTEFATDGFTALLWQASIAHSITTWKKTYLIFFDNDAEVWRLYEVAAGGLTVDTGVTCTNSGGFLKLKAPTFINPSLNFSVVRPI